MTVVPGDREAALKYAVLDTDPAANAVTFEPRSPAAVAKAEAERIDLARHTERADLYEAFADGIEDAEGHRRRAAEALRERSVHSSQLFGEESFADAVTKKKTSPAVPLVLSGVGVVGGEGGSSSAVGGSAVAGKRARSAVLSPVSAAFVESNREEAEENAAWEAEDLLRNRAVAAHQRHAN